MARDLVITLSWTVSQTWETWEDYQKEVTEVSFDEQIVLRPVVLRPHPTAQRPTEGLKRSKSTNEESK